MQLLYNLLTIYIINIIYDIIGKCNTVLHNRILENKKTHKNKKQDISVQVYMGMKLHHTEEFKVNSR